ncbi:hypothetical protein J3R82DRAFT_10859 [Butyriboletus roseoflavus]|nr:hypothetical protein J3R82DRAFT_10859 [Butyriboletus roseoflavus]
MSPTPLYTQTHYLRYTIYDIPLVDIYGANLPKLQAIKAMVDPDNVVGLTDGFKI